MSHAKEILLKYWGFSTFLPVQEQIIDQVLHQKHTLALLPTGGGKSICYQLPVMMSEGVGIVISPLIALMEDQVLQLKQRGIKAIALHAIYKNNDIIQAFDNLQFGDYKFLYISPERLNSSFIQDKIKSLNVSLIAIDEAHCISQWGHDFRPSYLKIPQLFDIKPESTVLALTATATKDVMADIKKSLTIDSLTILKSPFYRKNININVIKRENSLDSLVQILNQSKAPIIVYVSTRKKTVEVAHYLNAQGFCCGFYHGGLNHDSRKTAMDNWMTEKTNIMVATNAFGMGIDKGNVEKVIHLDIPHSLENYVQEIGRAGRSIEKASAYLIYNASSVHFIKKFIEEGLVDPTFCKKVYEKIYTYYQISKGHVDPTPKSFDFKHFCQTYNLPLVKTFNALQAFELEGLIITSQFSRKKSTFKTIVNHRILINYQNRNPIHGNLLKELFRNYGGSFEQKVNLDEATLAAKLGKSKQEIIQLLEQITKDNIIDYKLFNQKSEIIFLEPRDDLFFINKINKNLKRRNKIKLLKLNMMLDYLEIQQCRYRYLQSYFGEQVEENCENCDICVSKDKPLDTYEIKNWVLGQVKESSMSLDQLLHIKPSLNRTELLNTLRLMIEKGTLKLNSQQKFEKTSI